MVYAYPYFAEHNNDIKWVKEKYNMILKYFGLFNISISIILILFAPLIIKLVFGSQYLDAVLPFRILSATYFITSTFRKVSGNLLVTQRKLRFNFVLGLVEGVLNIIMNIVFISKLGSVGASLSSLIAVTITSVCSTSYFMKITRSKDKSATAG
jgi:O-antigen/teichoic acid export membrane protein